MRIFESDFIAEIDAIIYASNWAKQTKDWPAYNQAWKLGRKYVWGVRGFFVCMGAQVTLLIFGQLFGHILELFLTAVRTAALFYSVCLLVQFKQAGWWWYLLGNTPITWIFLLGLRSRHPFVLWSQDLVKRNKQEADDNS